MAMNAVSGKWDVTLKVARKIGIPEGTIQKWKVRGRVSAFEIIPLITASRGKLTVADFTEQKHDDA